MTIRVETVGGVAKVTIDNPAQKNALTNDMKLQLLEAFRSFADDDAVRAVVLTGAGNAFCAGSDVSSMGKADIRGGRHRLHVAHSMLRAMVHLEKPILAAVRGPRWAWAGAWPWRAITSSLAAGQIRAGVQEGRPCARRRLGVPAEPVRGRAAREGAGALGAHASGEERSSSTS